MNEAQRKIKICRDFLEQRKATAIRFRGVDWFSWITCGGSNVVILTSETGVAEVLITQEKALILTDGIEASRMREEEVPTEFEIVSGSWMARKISDRMVSEFTDGRDIYSDRPEGKEQDLPKTFRDFRLQIQTEELARYRSLCVESAEAMTETLQAAEPTWSECDLAAEGAKNLWRRGIHPTLVLAAGAVRLPKYRHPVPTKELLSHRAMLVFCARRSGLYANLTRFVSFTDLTTEEEEAHRTVAEIESVAFNNSKPGRSLSECFEAIREEYERKKLPKEIEKQHFGGLTGYLSREYFAKPEEETKIPKSGALAWNPTVTGAKIEDTVLVHDDDVEILTVDPKWPTFSCAGRKRPGILVRKW